MPLNFSEETLIWVASRLSGDTGALGAKALDIRNWLLWFSCALEEFWAVVAQLADWHTNYSPPWDSYRALISCRIIAIDKRPGVHPVGIGETLMRDFDKLVFRAAGDQAKVSYIGSGY